MIKTKKILIALAVIGANMLHNMPVYTSLAAEPDYTIVQGSTVVNYTIPQSVDTFHFFKKS